MIKVGPFAIMGDWDDSDCPPDLVEIRMPPTPIGVHGVGWHRSSRSSLYALAEAEVEGKTFLDLGAGTGIVSVAAAKLGASGVYASEIDEAAVEFAWGVIELNDVDVVWVPQSSPDYPEVDVCVANLGNKGVRLRSESPALQRARCLIIDGDGFWIDVHPDGRMAMRRPPSARVTADGQIASCEVLSPRGRDMTPQQAASDVVAYLLELPDSSDVVCDAEGRVYLASSLRGKAREIQAILDVQFGPRKVEIF